MWISLKLLTVLVHNIGDSVRYIYAYNAIKLIVLSISQNYFLYLILRRENSKLKS